MSLRHLLVPLALALLLLSACTPQQAVTQTASAASPTDTPTAPLPTDTPTPVPPTDTPTPPPTDTPTPTPAPAIATTPASVPLTETPGLMISGYVKLQDGTGLAGVTICRNYASYNGTVVATTDANGFFQSQYAFIPGDEMVGVWALAPGYTFDPPSYRWRHYYGPEERPLDFMASPLSGTETPTPPAPCP